jgi:hypothetical protein
VSSTGDDETRLLPRDDEALLPTVVTAFRDRPFSSRGSLAAADDDDDGDHGASSSRLERRHQPPRNLPMPLRVLFGCNGVTLALPSTALMYIVNTRIAVPLSVLPAYASVAFLPFSLKPLYAVATHWLDRSLPPPAAAATTSTPTRSRRRRRHVLLSVLLLLNSATIFGTYCARDVPSCFVWAFARGITSAWAEFLLGLALLSRVGGAGGGAVSGSVNRRQGAEEEEEEEDGVTPATATTDDDGTGTEDTASFRASRFQAEAAAARSLGSLVAYAFTATYFGLAGLTKNGTESRAAITESDVWNLLAVAALVHVVGSALALASRVGASEPELPSKPSEDGESDEGPWFGCLGRIRALLRTAAARLPTTSRDPSYHRVGAGSEVNRPIDENNDVNQEEAAAVEFDRQPLDAATPSSSFSIAATLMVGSLQVALVLMTVRQPIVGATSAGAWWCGWIACVVALVGSAVHYSSARGVGDGGTFALSRRQSHPDTTATHRVGLFLLLRHAVPSCGYLVGSYVYTLLEEHPVVLQVLAVHGSAMTTVAAWSYGWFGESFAKISSNEQRLPRNDPHPRHQFHHAVIPVIVITTIAASLMSLTQLAYVYFVVPPPMVSIIVPQLSLILIVKSLTTLADEWKFLPDVVLATLSAVEDDKEEEVAASPQMETREADTASTCSLPRRRGGESNDEARGSGSHSLERDLKYGSLISCIDFGEQLGSLLMGPLVAVLGVTRDGAQGRWVHFDRLIIVGALLSVMSLLLLWILPGVNLSTIFRARSSFFSGCQSRHS